MFAPLPGTASSLRSICGPERGGGRQSAAFARGHMPVRGCGAVVSSEDGAESIVSGAVQDASRECSVLLSLSFLIRAVRGGTGGAGGGGAPRGVGTTHGCVCDVITRRSVDQTTTRNDVSVAVSVFRAAAREPPGRAGKLSS